MSEPAIKPRQPINLEEFERRLRGPEPSSRDIEDPLAELARLVEGGADPISGMFSDGRSRWPTADKAPPVVAVPRDERPTEPPRPAPRLVADVPVVPPVVAEAPAEPGNDWDPELRDWEGEPQNEVHAREPALEEHAARRDGAHIYDVDEPREAEDMDAAFTPQLTGAGREAPLEPPQARWADEDEAPREQEAEQEAEDDYHEEPRRSRKALYYMGGACVVVLGLIGGTLAMHGGSIRSAGIPTISAPTGPSKVQPEVTSNDSLPSSPSTILDKPGDKIKPSRVVSNEEQPIDLSKQSLPPRADSGVAAPSNLSAAGNDIFPPAKRVKTVSVRPDGSIIDGDASAPPPALTPRPAAVPAPPPRPMASLTSPTSAPPVAKPTTPKSTARVVTTPTAHPAEMDTGDTVATTPPAVARPKPVAPKPLAVASNDPGVTTASGKFAVQFAAAGSDAEAREKAGKVQSQFGAALGGRRAAIIKGDANGKTVFRVRVGGMSREDAVALCVKVKASGGSCFVAGA